MKQIEINTEELDFLNEIINVGSGNAAVALGQLLGADVEMDIPDVKLVDQSRLSSVLDSMRKPVVGVKMKVVGDFKGHLFFIVSKENKEYLKKLAENARFGGDRIKNERDESTLEEIGNIMSGVFLYSIHDFCGLNIYHSIPELSEDILLSLVDESVATKMMADPSFIWIESLFKVGGKTENKIPVFFIMILSIDSVSKLKTAIQKAIEKMFGK